MGACQRPAPLPAVQSSPALLDKPLPAARQVLDEFLHPESAAELVQPGLDYVIDCIDSIAPKQQLICAAHQRGIRVVSSMGAGGRMDPSRVQVGPRAPDAGALAAGPLDAQALACWGHCTGTAPLQAAGQPAAAARSATRQQPAGALTPAARPCAPPPPPLQVAELSDTFNDAFAANIRRGLRKKGAGPRLPRGTQLQPVHSAAACTLSRQPAVPAGTSSCALCSHARPFHVLPPETFINTTAPLLTTTTTAPHPRQAWTPRPSSRSSQTSPSPRPRSS